MSDELTNKIENEEADSTENEDTEEVFSPDSVIIVEDGTCVVNANSYVTYEEAVAYQTARNRTDWLEMSPEDQVASILRGTEYLDSVFNWKGRRKFESQELAFPRVMLIDLDGFEVLGIPKRIKNAALEAAYFKSLEESEETTNDSGPVKRKKVDVLEMEYFNNSENTSANSDTSEDTTSKYKSLNRILRGLYFPKRWKGSVMTRAHWTNR